eukprot:11548886-Heterocapsa_arctica.AAC.1
MGSTSATPPSPSCSSDDVSCKKKPSPRIRRRPPSKAPSTTSAPTSAAVARWSYLPSSSMLPQVSLKKRPSSRSAARRARLACPRTTAADMAATRPTQAM